MDFMTAVQGADGRLSRGFPDSHTSMQGSCCQWLTTICFDWSVLSFAPPCMPCCSRSCLLSLRHSNTKLPPLQPALPHQQCYSVSSVHSSVASSLSVYCPLWWWMFLFCNNEVDFPLSCNTSTSSTRFNLWFSTPKQMLSVSFIIVF